MNTPLTALDPGSVQVYCTPERYCCSTVIADALRVSAQGKSTLIVQLLKGGIDQGIASPMRLGEAFVWVRPPLLRRIQTADVSEDEVIVLEEIGLAVKWGLILENELLQMIDHKPHQTELILVGTEMPELLRDWADVWTQIKSPRLTSAIA
jgi:cob(I)alamin adenosyltransferase